MIHGVLNVYKEKGYTSHDVVAKLRGITGQKKIGHTGTLDPDATGVLPVCLGKATKLCDMLTDKDKTYEAVLLLGVSTDTQDAGGEVLGTADTAGIGEEEVREARWWSERHARWIFTRSVCLRWIFPGYGWKSPVPKGLISVHYAMISVKS